MKGFLKSKLVLSLVAFLLIASAVGLPLAGSLIHAHAQPPIPTPPPPPSPDILVTTDVDCSTSTTPVATFNTTTIVSGTAILDTFESTEGSQGEPLVLKDTAGKITPLMVSLPTNQTTSSASFKFTLPATDSLVACVTGADADEEGTIIIKSSVSALDAILNRFIPLLKNSLSCAKDYFLTFATGPIKKLIEAYRLDQISNLFDLKDLYDLFSDIEQGKYSQAAILLKLAEFIPFEACAEAIFHHLVPEFTGTTLGECLIGTTGADKLCKRVLGQRFKAFIPPFIVF